MNFKKTTAALFLWFLLILASQAFLLKAEEFSQEQAYEHLKYIADTIGPRPLGSPQEKAALAYFAEKLDEFGFEVERQPVTGAGKTIGKDSLNTNSFNVIGRLPGQSRREIVIGAHIDSSSPEIPGANDDASGVAAILEAARVLSRGSHQSSLVFVAFCGEEAGLVGSKAFVEQYPLANVVLMLQLDMTSDDAPLTLWIDTKASQSPRWLVSASIDAFHTLGYRHMDYPTAMQSLNSLIWGAGSDHEPFMEKGIPAIAFVSDITYPIHTRHDSLEYFKPEGLERSGRLILELVDRFDKGVPDRNIDRYTLLMLGERPIYIEQSFIEAILVISLIVGFAALVRLSGIRSPGMNGEDEKKIKKTWPKLLTLHFLILAMTFASLWIMQLLTGFRLPWYVQPGPHILYVFLFFLLGIWLGLQVLRKWRLRKSPSFYFVRTFAYFGVLIVGVRVLAGPRIALFPATGLLLTSLAILAPWAWLKGLLWLISPLLMFRLLVLPEYYEFVYRATSEMASAAAKTSPAFLIVALILVLFVILWSQPFLLGFAAVCRSSGRDLFGLKSFRRLITIIPIGILIIGGAACLQTLAGYEPPWEQKVTVTQNLDGENNNSFVEFASLDYLRGIRANINGEEELISIRSCRKKIAIPFEMDWLKESISAVSGEKGTEESVRVRIQLDFEKQPYAVTLRLNSDQPFAIEESNVNYSLKKNQATIRWFSFPPLSLQPEIELTLPKEAKLNAEIIATFLETALPITCTGENKWFVHRAEIHKKLDIVESAAE